MHHKHLQMNVDSSVHFKENTFDIIHIRWNTFPNFPGGLSPCLQPRQLLQPQYWPNSVCLL